MKYIVRHTKSIKILFILFILWRVFLLVPQYWSIDHLANKFLYLGGGLKNYIANPWLWGWANFDGEHYLTIAQHGYKPLTYFFFPLYPTLMRVLTEIIGVSLKSFLISGLFISHVSFVVSLFFLFKLVKLDFKESIATWTVVLLLIFPTSFFFASVYTESLFFMLTVVSFYFAKKSSWILAAFFGILASATRLAGVILLPALVAEYFIQNKDILKHLRLRWLVTRYYSIIFLLCIPLGLVFYMIYLNQITGDPLAFFHSVEIFGDQRSTRLIMLPQVFYRYIFKILPLVPMSYWQGFFTVWLEFLTASLFLILSVYALFRMRLSYSIFLVGSYILPTLSGSFSSYPRYALTAFPAFVLMAIFVDKFPRVLQISIIAVMTTLLFVAESLFLRGYWLS